MCLFKGVDVTLRLLALVCSRYADNGLRLYPYSFYASRTILLLCCSRLKSMHDEQNVRITDLIADVDIVKWSSLSSEL